MHSKIAREIQKELSALAYLDILELNIQKNVLKPISLIWRIMFLINNIFHSLPIGTTRRKENKIRRYYEWVGKIDSVYVHTGDIIKTTYSVGHSLYSDYELTDVRKRILNSFGYEQWEKIYKLYISILNDYKQQRNILSLRMEDVDEISKVELSNNMFEKIVKDSKYFISQENKPFYEYLLTIEQKGLFSYRNMGEDASSFCLHFPHSKTSFVHIEKKQTLHDIFSFFHEIGHVYNHYINDIYGLEDDNNLICEYYALSFEFYFVNLIGDERIKSVHAKKIIGDLMYWFFFLRIILLVEKYNSTKDSDGIILTEFYKMQQRFYSEIVTFEQKDLLLALRSNPSFIIDYGNYIDYVLAYFLGISTLCNENNDIFSIKKISLVKEEREDLLHTIGSGSRIKESIDYFYYYLLNKLKQEVVTDYV